MATLKLCGNSDADVELIIRANDSKVMEPKRWHVTRVRVLMVLKPFWAELFMDH